MTKIVSGLFYFDSRTGIFKLFFDFCCLFPVNTFLDRLGRRLDEILGLLEAKAGDRAHLLDHVDLLLAGRLEDDVELVLLGSGLGGGSPTGGRSGGDGDRSSGGDAEGLLDRKSTRLNSSH